MNRFEFWALGRVASKDTTRPSITEPWSTGRYVAATDGHRLHVAYHAAAAGAVIPPEKPKKAERSKPAGLQIRECAKQRPRIEQVIPKSGKVPFETLLHLETDPKCTAAIGRCDDKYFVATLTPERGLSVVFKNDARCRAEAAVHLNPRYVADAIEFVSGGGRYPVRVYFGDALAPVVFHRAEDAQIQAVVMPVRK